MTSSAETIISSLIEAFVDPPSTKNAIQTTDGRVFHIDKDLWDASPILREHSASEPNTFKMLTVPENSVGDMLRVHRRGVFPQDFGNLLNLLSATKQLGLQELTSRCFEEVVSAVEDFTVEDFPSVCTPEAVLNFFGILVEGPPRTFSVYRRQLMRIEKHCGGDRAVMIKALNILQRRYEEIDRLELGSIPVDFIERSVPIAIVKRNGKLETVIFHDYEWKKVSASGKYCDLQKLNVGDFFRLKYGSYLLFKSGDCVFRKNLQDDSEPEKILDHCSIFLTRGKFTFAVVWSNNICSVLQWKDDSHFVKIHSRSSMLFFIDFDPVLRLLSMQDAITGFSVYELGMTIPLFIQNPDQAGIRIALMSGEIWKIKPSSDQEKYRDHVTVYYKEVDHFKKDTSCYYGSSRADTTSDIVIGKWHFEFQNEQLVLKEDKKLIHCPVVLSSEETPILSELWMCRT